MVFRREEPPYRENGPKITYDPSAVLQSGVADARTFRTVALLYEIMHAACDQKYVKPAWAAADLYGRNFHIQQNLTTDGQIGQFLVARQKLVDANYGRAITTLNSDRSKIISASLRAYLLERINYGQGMPDVQGPLGAQLDRWAERHELKVSALVALAATTLWSRLHGLVGLEIEGNFASMDLDPATLYETEVADVVGSLAAGSD